MRNQAMVAELVTERELETPVKFEKKIIEIVTFSIPVREIIERLEKLQIRIEQLEKRTSITPIMDEWNNEEDDDWDELPTV